VSVPGKRHDECRFAEVETFSECVVAAVVDHDIDLWNDRGLREPAQCTYLYSCRR
jgi:hypothetical protein